MGFSVVAAVGAGGHESPVVKLNRGAETAPLGLPERRLRVEHHAVMGEIEFEAVLGFHARDGAHPQRRMQVAHGEREEQSLVVQPQ